MSVSAAAITVQNKMTQNPVLIELEVHDTHEHEHARGPKTRGGSYGGGCTDERDTHTTTIMYV